MLHDWDRTALAFFSHLVILSPLQRAVTWTLSLTLVFYLHTAWFERYFNNFAVISGFSSWFQAFCHEFVWFQVVHRDFSIFVVISSFWAWFQPLYLVCCTLFQPFCRDFGFLVVISSFLSWICMISGCSSWFQHFCRDFNLLNVNSNWFVLQTRVEDKTKSGFLRHAPVRSEVDRWKGSDIFLMSEVVQHCEG